MSLSHKNARKGTIAFFLAMLITQVTLAGIHGCYTKLPAGVLPAGLKTNKFHELHIPVNPGWVHTCDSLSRILAAPIFEWGHDCRWQPAYTAWIEKEGKAGVEQFMGGLFIVINPVYTSRDITIPLYQAYESITFDAGFETPDGDQFETQILSDEVVDQPDPPADPGPDNRDMNWIVARSFDENGNVIGEIKQFFDHSGSLLQTQQKLKHRDALSQSSTQVFATQPIRDAQGRNAATTLSAPINNSEFAYNPSFVRAPDGSTYDYRNFDRFKLNGNETDKTNNPDAVGGQNVPGTLGWYYSSNNTWEPYTPTTNYPFTRQSYYRDGTGNVKKTAGAGEVFKIGNGHEVSSYVTPVISELDQYLQVRNKFFSATELGTTPGSLATEAIQALSIDPDGKIGAVIQDLGGRTLMSARPGSDLVVNNTATVAAGDIYYFRLFTAGNVIISSTSNVFYNMETEQPVNIGTGGSVAAGYYKIVNTGIPDLTVKYSNGYTDISYSFYNQLGQVVATIAPEGVKKLLGTGLNNYTSKNDVPFISLYEYDGQGRLVKGTSYDEGVNELVYRNDGAIRFTQNAEQKINGSYSYTNYDQKGRAIESGEYKPEAGGILFNSDLTAANNPMRDILEDVSATGGLINGTKKDVIMTLYDAIDKTHGQANYDQDQAFLGGNISMTQRYSVIQNNTPNSANLISSTWYNYDEEGKTVWSIRYIKGLGYKTTDYTYDVQGRLVKKDFQKGDPTGTERFIHYYDYDPITQNLLTVRTSVDDINKILQATYIYYLHGPLKRVELATDLQGVDYTYNLQGQLKAINNSNKANDPGGDGSNGKFADAFGMVLDYFTGDYQNSRLSGIQPITGVNAIGTDSYSGNIKAMTWFSKKPASFSSIPNIEDPTSYVFQYDDKYQFTESSWFVNNPAPFTATGFNKETIKNPTNGAPAYDANGNILYLQRTGETGAPKDNFTYNYLNTLTNTGSTTNYNTNKLQSVVNNITGLPYATYTYNQLGQLIGEANTDGGTDKSKYIEYDVSGKVVTVYRDVSNTQPVVEYEYNEMGDRIIKRSYNAGQLSQITYYVGSVIYTQLVTNGTFGAITPQEYKIEGGNGRLGTFYRQIPVYAYELKDNLGNVRAVVAKSAVTNSLEVRMYSDYYPFGMAMRGNSEDYRYGYQGQNAEKDGETDWNAFELRMYDSKIARWLNGDPEGQFQSPYVSMGNNPVSGTDPNGGFASLPGALANQFFSGNRGHIYQTDGGEWGYNCNNCGLQDGSGAFFIYKNGQYDRDKYKKMDALRDGVNYNYVFDHDTKAYAQNQPTLVPGFRPGMTITPSGDGGFKAGWNEAIEYPTLDPVDLATGAVSALGKALGKAGGKSLGKAVAGNIALFGSEAEGHAFVVNASRAVQPEGMLDVIVHGNTMQVEVGKYLVDQRVLAGIIRSNPQWKGQTIRLISCNTGELYCGFAQRLANKLNVKVWAPSDKIWAWADGSLGIGPTEELLTGKWKDFYPGGAYR